MRPKYPLLVMFVIVIAGCCGGILWFLFRSEPAKAPLLVLSPKEKTDAFQRDRDQLSIQISKAHVSLDEQVTFTIRLQNIYETEVFVVKSANTRAQTRERDASFFLSVEPFSLSLFGIFPSGPDDRHKLAPGEVDVSEWRGSLRQLLNGAGVPIEQQKPGEYSVRVSYLAKCGGLNSDKSLCNAVTSEWVKVQEP